jgi:phospho-N-acetylmuramoyl-pentapeptide-transferase
MYLKPSEYEKLNILSSCLMGGILAFLIFNVSKAKVFMGDTGSLSLGGFIGAISIFSSNSFFIPIIGIMFVLSSISVIIQVVYFKKTKKRVFLMAPFHHHLQLKGWTETKIVYVYVVMTAIFGALSLLFYL